MAFCFLVLSRKSILTSGLLIYFLSILASGQGKNFPEINPEFFGLTYNITDTHVQWSYTSCSNLITSLYFSDYSDSIYKLFEYDPVTALKYTIKLYEIKVICPEYITFPFTQKGDLLFILETVIEDQKFYNFIKYQTVCKYKCEFQDSSILEIFKMNQTVMLLGPDNYYEIFSHGNIENSYGSQGELMAYLCNHEFVTGKWIEGCKDPSLLVGKKINKDACSCVVQGELYESHLGKCYFDYGVNKGFLVFADNVKNIKISGFNTNTDILSISIEGEKAILKSKKVLNKGYLYGSIIKKNIIGKKINIKSQNSTFSCVIGLYPFTKIKNSASHKYGSIYISILLALTLLTITTIEVTKKRA